MVYGMKGGDANRQLPKAPGPNRFSHTQNTPYGMGDHYGTGLKAKVGRVRGETVGINPASEKKLKTPPKNFA